MESDSRLDKEFTDTSSRAQRQSSIDEKIPNKSKRKKPNLKELATEAIALGIGDDPSSQTSTPEEDRKKLVRETTDFSMFEPHEFKVSRRRHAYTKDREKLLKTGTIKSETEAQGRRIIDVYGPDGSKPFDDLVVKKSDPLWAKEFYETNKDEMYPKKSTSLVLLINNEKFRNKSQRYGTEFDAKRLNSLFEQLGCFVIQHDNLIMTEMVVKISNLSKATEHTNLTGKTVKSVDADAVFIIILSHGNDGIVFGSNDGQVEIEELIDMMNNENAPLWIGKPKFFIVQACRGKNADPGTDNLKAIDSTALSKIMRDEGTIRICEVEKTTTFEKIGPCTIPRQKLEHIFVKLTEPTYSDILLAYSSTKCHSSFRLETTGTWFISAICEVFKDYAHTKHILEMFPKVNRRVARYESDELSREKQIPEVRFTLTRDYYFFPGVQF